MNLDIVFSTYTATPITASAGAFEVAKNTAKPISSQGTLNLASHREAGLYIFRQIADGHEVATTISPTFLYDIGGLEGEIPLPDIKQDIPTRASEETISFLKGMLASGIFDE